MKSVLFVLFSFCLATTNGFMPAVSPTIGSKVVGSRTGSENDVLRALFAGPEDEKEAGLDLDLEEMFTMFDAADKEESFDDAIKKVKTDETDS